jgi:2-polyprenyl-6-methoxyphenol hydroxylase-like FAD-dependent oxidoreductase
MAFEDAAILCRKLKEVKDLSVKKDVVDALRNYENERLVRYVLMNTKRNDVSNW